MHVCKNLLVGRKIITVDAKFGFKDTQVPFSSFLGVLVETEAYKVNKVRKCIIIMM